MTTPLTLYGTNTATTTLTTADGLVSGTGGGATNKNMTVGTSTGYAEFLSQGSGSAWAAAGSIGSPTGKGWLFDVATLEGKQFVAGNWTPTVRLQLGNTTFTLVTDIYVRAYIRSSGGTYTLIGTMLLSAQTLTSTSTIYAFANTSLALAAFATGDKLYIDMWMNVTTNSTAASTAVIKCYVSTSSTLGVASDMQIVTPGYQSSGLPAYTYSYQHKRTGRVV